jgi:hypothetical protein
LSGEDAEALLTVIEKIDEVVAIIDSFTSVDIDTMADVIGDADSWLWGDDSLWEGYGFIHDFADQAMELHSKFLGEVLGPIEDLPILGPIAKGILKLDEVTQFIIGGVLDLGQEAVDWFAEGFEKIGKPFEEAGKWFEDNILSPLGW